MSNAVNLVFPITSEFDEDALKKYVGDFKGVSRKTTDKYQRLFWSIDGLSLILFEKRLVVQGHHTDFTKRFLKGLPAIKGIAFDSKSAEAFRRLFPTKQNSVVCSICQANSMCITGCIEGLDILFKMECEHSCSTEAPFLTLNNRILPDLNMLISKTVSRLINLNNLKGVEIVFPGFILDVIDEFKGSDKKKAVSTELESLRKLAEKGLITLNTLSNLGIHLDAEKQKEEDKIILDFAHFTNSILLTSDLVLKERALATNRPVIFIDPKDFDKIKTIEETRR